MEQILLRKTPRSSQIVTVEEKKIRVNIDYNQMGDRWLISFENITTGEKREGIEARSYKPLLYHYRRSLNMKGDFFFLPEGAVQNPTATNDYIGYKDLMQDKVGLYYVNPEEV